mmetsp:Transcript_127362/g.207348  ORF Transcript_127362/g.207348 Transcript_127362/m.207348 type:complete len:106 (+) Transcript_127362:884-1201(+)
MADPIMSPTPHSLTMKNVATTFVQNSGALDPKASSVAPATSLERPNLFANCIVEGTKYTSEITFKFLNAHAIKRAQSTNPIVQLLSQELQALLSHGPNKTVSKEK